MSIPRPEYPRPQFVRANWTNLNGIWEFAFDDENTGLARGLQDGQTPLPEQILVPFAFQARASGIGNTTFHDTVWYRRFFNLPPEAAGKRTLLHFGAVDYRAEVWINGKSVVRHEGGHVPFSADITSLLEPGANVVVVRAEDPSRDRQIPRGKQYWEEESKGIFYTRTTGIWQTVWLEYVDDLHLEWVRYTPDIDREELQIEYRLSQAAPGEQLQGAVSFDGALVTTATVSAAAQTGAFTVAIPNAKRWAPSEPHLYDIEFTVGADRVQSYVGMRKVHIEGDRFFLNNEPFYNCLVLDQGYWPESNLTPPSDEAIRYDIEMTKAFGFNGARKHQKVEDPRYLYWADRLGLVVWGEMANAYEFTPEAGVRLLTEWAEAVRRDYNHPCIIAWTPLNESWGVPNAASDSRQAQFVAAVYHLTKALDPTRPVSGNDGWEQTATDIAGFHDYSATGDEVRSRWAEPTFLLEGGHTAARKLAFVPPWGYQGQPLMVTEWGGIKYAPFGETPGWGYQGAATEEEFLFKYRNLIEAIYACGGIWGHCYTQLTDVEQEVNGLLTYDRQPKVDPALIKVLNDLRR